MASHAYTTTPLLRPAPIERRRFYRTAPARQQGPVSVAIATMRAADPDRSPWYGFHCTIASCFAAGIVLVARI